MFKGLRSLIHPSSDLAADKAFWANALGIEPYFDEPFYVGFNVGGYELGLNPDGANEGYAYPVAYWGVDNIVEAAKELVEKGIAQRGDISDVGGGTRMATFLDASGAIFGLIENPGFKAEA